jgi:hypothetical protein
MKKISLLTALAMTAALTTAQAQLYVTGEITAPPFQPGTGLPLGSGTAADLLFPASAPGIDPNGIAYSSFLSIPASVHGLTTGTRYIVKVANSGFSVSVPAGFRNQYALGPASGQPLIVYGRTAPFGDGLIPELSGNAFGNAEWDGWVWTSETPAVYNAYSWYIIGNFYEASTLGGSNWTQGQPTNLQLTDAGYGTPTDGVIGITVTGINAGTYQFKFFSDNTFADPAIGSDGFNGGNGGGDINFTVFGTADQVSFVIDTRTGRYNVIVVPDTPPPPIPAGFYAVGPWSNTYDTTTLLYNGPIPGTKSRAFTVPTPGAYVVQVGQSIGGPTIVNTWPNTGIGYPFVTTVANQEVVVVFDQNTYTDGYGPATNLIGVFNNNPRTPTNGFGAPGDEVQAVGSWQNRTGLGLIGPFTPNDDDHNLLSVGSGFFSNVFNHGANGPISNPQYKAVARIASMASLLGSGDWSIQMGSSGTGGNGLTMNGNNPDLSAVGTFESGTSIGFTAELNLGRMASSIGPIATNQAPAPYTLPSYVNTFTTVEDWMNF